jgi:hypothetical protein
MVKGAISRKSEAEDASGVFDKWKEKVHLSYTTPVAGLAYDVEMIVSIAQIIWSFLILR